MNCPECGGDKFIEHEDERGVRRDHPCPVCKGGNEYVGSLRRDACSPEDVREVSEGGSSPRLTPNYFELGLELIQGMKPTTLQGVDNAQRQSRLQSEPRPPSRLEDDEHNIAFSRYLDDQRDSVIEDHAEANSSELGNRGI